MRVALHSDLHLEGNSIPHRFLEDDSFDVLVLAGDIVTNNSTNKLALIKEYAGSKPVIYIPGNHEFYKGSIQETTALLKEVCEAVGIIYANRSVVRFDNVSFVCATGWSDLESFVEFPQDQKEMEVRGISDFYAIKNHTVADMIQMAKADRNFIETSLKILKEERPSDTVVVVTHFAPTEAHGNANFAPSPISSYFSNKWEEIMYEFEPSHWMYGHTHYLQECDVYHTKVHCNQHGYGRECNGSYNSNKIIDI